MKRSGRQRRNLLNRALLFIEKRKLHHLPAKVQWKSPRCHLASAFLTDWREHQRRYSR
ncbi:hypothetical protein [Deinococcus frigens]|uniref:hypothetical protein n=1 Tax=Deinococcus frigens TaxID=249403 RepID=UPI000AEDBE2D|nr:hypothetical protein [Deinococcus frigens]